MYEVDADHIVSKGLIIKQFYNVQIIFLNMPVEPHLASIKKKILKTTIKRISSEHE